MIDAESVRIVKIVNEYPLETQHWRIARLFGLTCAVTAAVALPYQIALVPATESTSLATQISIVAISASIFFTLIAWGGLKLGYLVGLDAPWLRAWRNDTKLQPNAAHWLKAVGLGLAAGLFCIAWGSIVPSSFHPLASTSIPNWWQGLLGSINAGVSEEVLCRLFLISLMVRLGALLYRSVKPGDSIYWIAIVLAALAFGALHLPLATAISADPLSAALIVEVITPNAVVGIICGWLFWRYGIEHAMLGHFSTDIVLHVVLPLTGVSGN